MRRVIFFYLDPVFFYWTNTCSLFYASSSFICSIRPTSLCLCTLAGSRRPKTFNTSNALRLWDNIIKTHHFWVVSLETYGMAPSRCFKSYFAQKKKFHDFPFGHNQAPPRCAVIWEYFFRQLLLLFFARYFKSATFHLVISFKFSSDTHIAVYTSNEQKKNSLWCSRSV